MRPAFVIGIGGGSAAGKSVVGEELRMRLAPLDVSVINQDRYFLKADRLPRHADPSGQRSWPDHNHPGSFDFPRLRRDVLKAREGDTDVIIVEGILVLHEAELRELMDLKLFVAADADERIVRRIRRNVGWGYDLDEICDFYLGSVRYRHVEFCEPTRSHADTVVPGGSHEKAAAEVVLTEVCERVRKALAS